MKAVANNPQIPMAFSFRYDGVSRIVDNALIDGEQQQIIGVEVRRNGKFSFKTKRFSLSKITELRQVEHDPKVRQV